MKKRVAIWGAGLLYQNNKEVLNKEYDIVVVVDKFYADKELTEV